MELHCWSCSDIVIVGVTWGILECPHCGIEFAVNHTLNTTTKPLETYAQEHMTGDRGSDLQYLASGRRGNNWGTLIFLGLAFLGIVPLVVLIIHLFKPRPKPPLRGYMAKAYVDEMIHHFVVFEPRGGVDVPVKLIPLDKLRMAYKPPSGTGDEYSPETAHFYYGNRQIGEYPNSSNKVEEINRYLDHIRA